MFCTIKNTKKEIDFNAIFQNLHTLRLYIIYMHKHFYFILNL